MAKEKRLIFHKFRTTEAEDALIKQKMKVFGITNQSAFYRAMVLNGYLLKIDLPEIRELIRLLKNLTNNVNQIAQRVNDHGSIYETEMDEILKKLQIIWDTLNQLLKELTIPSN